MKKFLIRMIGSLCILAAVATLFMPAWLKIEGVKRSELRNLRSEVGGIVEDVGDSFAEMASNSDNFKEELKDNDLPYMRSSIKKRFAEIGNLTDELLDEEVSLHEILQLSMKAPGIIRDMDNLLSSSVSNIFIGRVTQYKVNEEKESDPDIYFSDENIQKYKNQLQSDMEDGVDAVSEISSVLFTVLAGVLFLILALAVLSAVTHMCNKGRWVKYLLLALIVIMVAVSAVCVPMVSDLIEDVAELEEPFEDMSLQMTAMPYIALVLMFVPVVLDIIFERKKSNKVITNEG